MSNIEDTKCIHQNKKTLWKKLVNWQKNSSATILIIIYLVKSFFKEKYQEIPASLFRSF